MTTSNAPGKVAVVTGEIIAFVLSGPRRLAINEILLRPAGQQ